MTVGKGGGAPSVFAPGQETPECVAVDPNAVYWLSGVTAMRAER